MVPSSAPSDGPNACAVVQVIVGIAQENLFRKDKLLEIEEIILRAAVRSNNDVSGRHNLQSSQSFVVGDTPAELSTVATTTICDSFNPFESVQMFSSRDYY